MLYTGALGDGEGPLRIGEGVAFASALLGILLTHELGHFAFARLHGVNASLPFFIPMPMVSPFGTMGAVIVMRDRIKSRNALLDIGASGPLAGMIVDIPVLLWGLAHSEVKPITGHGIQEGQSLLYMLLKRIALGPIPAGHDVFLGPVAFAGWAGLFVTMLNLLPIGQLDGGHVAYALFGERQNRLAHALRWALLAFVPFNLAVKLVPAMHAGVPFDEALAPAVGAAMPWLGWFALLRWVLPWLSGGSDHPPTEPGELSRGRRVVAVGTLALFALLFMPTPWSTY